MNAKILLVEDDANLGFVIKDNLSQKGYDVFLCADGEEGEKQFRNNSIDLCILDIMLPKKRRLCASPVHQGNEFACTHSVCHRQNHVGR